MKLSQAMKEIEQIWRENRLSPTIMLHYLLAVRYSRDLRAVEIFDQYLAMKQIQPNVDVVEIAR